MFVTNWISPTKIQKISEITNFFRHYFLSRTEVLCKLGIGNTRDAGILGTSIRYSLGYSSGNVEEEKGQSIN